MDAAEFAGRVRPAARRAAPPAAGAVGVKSVAAYRTGLRLDPTRPSPEVVTGAAARWLAAGPGAAGWRMADPVLQRLTLWAAVDLGLPIQFHIGFGDSDIRMPRGRPDAAHRLAAPAPRAGHAAALLAVAPAGVVPGVHLPARPPRRRARSCTTWARGAAPRCSRRRPRSRRSRGCCTPPTRTAPRSCTCSGRSPTAWRCARCCATGSTAGEWAAADAERVAHLVSHGNAERVYRL